MFHEFDFPVRIIEGAGTVGQLGAEAARLKARSVIIITDRGVRNAGLLEGAADSLTQAGLAVTVFDDVDIDPGRATVTRCKAAVRSARADVIVAIGGGSAICAAKGAALVVTNGGDIRDYKGIGNYRLPPLPVIAVPTTAGSGSEVSPKMIIYDEESGEKMTIGGTECYPAAAILDPLLLVNLPYNLAVASSMDALSHAVEAFITRAASVFTDACAWWAADIIYNHVERASVPGGDLESKTQVLAASSLANIACGTAGLGMVHALQQGMSEQSHGVVCGLLLPEVMEFNMPACLPKMARMAQALGVPPGLSDREAALEGIANLRALYGRLGFPEKIMSPDPWSFSLEERLEKVFKYSGRLISHNVREITREDAAAILKKVTGIN